MTDRTIRVLWDAVASTSRRLRGRRPRRSTWVTAFATADVQRLQELR